jgi:hypothetical protein
MIKTIKKIIFFYVFLKIGKFLLENSLIGMDNSDSEVKSSSKRQRFLSESDDLEIETEDTKKYRGGYPVSDIKIINLISY